jgi:hypothetical protein
MIDQKASRGLAFFYNTVFLQPLTVFVFSRRFIARTLPSHRGGKYMEQAEEEQTEDIFTKRARAKDAGVKVRVNIVQAGLLQTRNETFGFWRIYHVCYADKHYRIEQAEDPARTRFGSQAKILRTICRDASPCDQKTCQDMDERLFGDLPQGLRDAIVEQYHEPVSFFLALLAGISALCIAIGTISFLWWIIH